MTKRKKNTKNIIIYTLVVLIMIIGGCLSIVGAIKLANLELNYEKDKVACDDKDYSSYVKYKETSTPGNANINSQLEILKTAMENARQANDGPAFEYLWNQYNQMLALQSQTSTKSGYYDYSEANEAKDKCYSLAEKQKESNKNSGLILVSVGCALVILSLGVGLIYWRVGKKHKKIKARSARGKKKLLF